MIHSGEPYGFSDLEDSFPPYPQLHYLPFLVENNFEIRKH